MLAGRAQLERRMTTLQIFADFHTIYLCDSAHNEDWSDLWNYQTVEDRIVALPHTIVFNTGRNMTVPVDVHVHGTAPDVLDLAADADHAVTGSVTCTSGELNLAGCTDYLPDAFALAISTGTIGVAFLSFGLGTIDPLDGLEGNDRYALHVWPNGTPSLPTVLKYWKGLDAK